MDANVRKYKVQVEINDVICEEFRVVLQKRLSVGGRVRDCVRSLPSSCPNRTRLDGVIMNLKLSCCACAGT